MNFSVSAGVTMGSVLLLQGQRISSSGPGQVISLQSGMSAAEDNVIFISTLGCDLLVVFGKEFNSHCTAFQITAC